MSGGGWGAARDQPRYSPSPAPRPGPERNAPGPRAPALSGDPDYRGRHRSGDWEDTGLLTADDLARQRAQADPPTSSWLSSYVVSHLRTLVPLAWGYALTWLLERAPFLPPELAALADDPTVVAGVTAVVTFLWYALWRWLEPRLPAFPTALVLGHPAEPRYPG